ncbi:MAG: hypothetical protein ACLQGP_01270 [Isosphaeraceae bacterium]
MRGVSLDREQATATIRHDATPRGSAQLLQRLSAAIRDGESSGSIPTPPNAIREATCTIHRHGSLLTTCEVLSDHPGRLRLRHASLRRDPAFARVVEQRVGTLPGVTRASVGPWTSNLLVHYDPGVLGTPRLLRLIEDILDDTSGWGATLPEPTRTRFAMANTTLGIAAVGQFAAPVLTLVSAVLLVGTNLRTFRYAWLQVRRRKFGLPVLYTVIVAATLASGQFFASAVMYWFFTFWHGRLRLELAGERRRLLDECLPRPSFTCLITPEGSEVLVPVDRLRSGDRVVVGADETVPADGRVIGGEAIVDERSVRGLQGASRKRAGDAVLAGSTVLAGSLRVEVTRLGDHTQASSIVRDLVAATSPAAGPMSPTLRTEVFANQAVGPTLATAGFGLLVGDLTAVGAILRPDYATGPGLAFSLETLHDAALCARRGIVVRQPDVFERLAGVDLIVLDDNPALSRVELEVTGVRAQVPETELLRYAASAFRHLADDRATALNACCLGRRIHLLDLAPVEFGQGVTVVHDRHRIRVCECMPTDDGSGPLVVEIDGTTAGVIEFGRSTRPAAAAALHRIREVAPVPVALVSNRSEADVAGLASLLGVDLYKGGFSPEDTARFLRACRDRGLRTAFIGHCRRRAAAAVEADVAVSLVAEADEHAGASPAHASVLLLQPRVDLFADLWEIARRHEGRLHEAQRFVLLPNVLCVAGAFLFGFTGLTAVMISNLGTFSLFNRAVSSLRELEPAGRGRSRNAGRTR